MPKHILERPSGRAFASADNVSTPSDQLVSSGPWRLTQYVPGEKTVLERYLYWFWRSIEKDIAFRTSTNWSPWSFRPGCRRPEVPRRAADALDQVKPENYQRYAEHQPKGNFTLYDLGPAMTPTSSGST